MLVLLKVLGIVTLAIVLVAIVAIRWLVRKLHGLVKENLPTPCRIHPEPEPNPQWEHAGIVRDFAEQYRALGFQEIGACSIPELGGLQFLAFFHAQERCYGCVYDHRKRPPTFDIVCLRPDETSVTGTNTRLGESLDQRPGRTVIRLEQAKVVEVFNAVRSHPAAAGERLAVSAEAFLPFFCKAYADYMNWRLKKGGTTRDEIRRQATQDGREVTDEIVEDTYQSMRERHLEQLKEGCLAQYLDDRRLTAAEWEHQHAITLAIPETFERKEILDTLGNVLPLDDEQRHQLDQVEATFGQTGLDVLANIIERNVGSLQLTKIGEVTEPVHAWILRVPEVNPARGPVGKNLQP